MIRAELFPQFPVGAQRLHAAGQLRRQRIPPAVDLMRQLAQPVQPAAAADKFQQQLRHPAGQGGAGRQQHRPVGHPSHLQPVALDPSVPAHQRLVSIMMADMQAVQTDRGLFEAPVHRHGRTGIPPGSYAALAACIGSSSSTSASSLPWASALPSREKVSLKPAYSVNQGCWIWRDGG